MTNAELLIECKNGLNIQVDSTDFDDVLTQKLLTVKSFMAGAGVSSAVMEDDQSVGAIVMGVGDLWNLGGGEIKFSPAFYVLLNQLTAESSVLKVTSSPTDGAVGVSASVAPALTFNYRIESYEVSIVDYSTLDSVSVTASLDVTGKILTLTPNSNLSPATKYAVVVESAVAYSGQNLDYTVIAFTTA